jgi:CspA family cold shock protein
MEDKGIVNKIGTIKWFSNTKGFGFILGDSEEDIFVHYSSITIDGYKTLKAGQTVNFDTQKGDKGLHAINVTPVEEKY